MANENETIEDIVAEMVRESIIHVSIPTTDLERYANRIEAARTAEKSSAVGNAAAIREALELLNQLFDSCVLGTHSEMTADEMDKVDELYFKTKAALSAPPRNCDRFNDSWDVLKAWSGGMDTASEIVKMIDWLLAPAAEQEGAGK